jgi:hypothetical protein
LADHHHISREDERAAEESAKTLAAASAAAIAIADSGAKVYDSLERGPELIGDMNKTHAARAARLVRRGERAGGNATARALERQSHTTRRLTR